ncbi:type II toxin-antitoxin system death-on-curing family toxin [Pseudonocardia eucalypti]|uniref:Type II toxin-antitoxin system death-on-curing family toxin n=1 Tax=Pseudonocardia eucalypti TaxID=648755 RepID=A0ABP9R7M2_9PSEU|nr:death-on-curing protein [Pseudonocardia eucalypti]
MTEYLDLDDLITIARAAVGPEPLVRDYGLLEAAIARPRATVFGQDAYPDLHLKAAALLHSLVCNHALVDGNKRLGFAACAVFLHLNGFALEATEDERVDLVVAVAAGDLADLEKIAEPLRAWSVPGG